jgi:hypothetical protein
MRERFSSSQAMRSLKLPSNGQPSSYEATLATVTGTLLRRTSTGTASIGTSSTVQEAPGASLLIPMGVKW